ncbi:Armadillo repeat-containing protein 2 [Boothiomyces sp. JEL0838]|nr:Armadillo repeat-containing protein 2 [Boothiomyces sp. JEL0838]
METKSKTKPFYALDLSRPTAAQVISEAKQSLRKASLLAPTRPFTPHFKRSKFQKVPDPIQPVSDKIKEIVYPKPLESQMQLPLDNDYIELLNCINKLPETREIRSFLMCLEKLNWLRRNEKDKIYRKSIVKQLLIFADAGILDAIPYTLLLYLTRESQILSKCFLWFSDNLDQVNEHACKSINSFIGLNLKNYTTIMGTRCELLINAISVVRTVGEFDKYQMTELLKEFLKKYKEDTTADEKSQIIRLLAQVIGCFREATSNGDCDPQVLDLLCDTIIQKTFQESEKIQILILKIFCNLSENETLRDVLSQPNIVEELLNQLVYSSENKEIQTRECYFLSNLTSNVGEIHQQILRVLEDLVALFGSITEASLFDETDSDLVLKMTRLLSNVSLDPKAGEIMVSMSELEFFMDNIDNPIFFQKEELLLNYIGFISNISFYFKPSCRLFSHTIETFGKLLPFLMNENLEFIVETCKIIANVFRFNVTIPNSIMNHLVQILVLLLDHTDVHVLYYSCGVLVNLLSTKYTELVYNFAGTEKFIDVFEYATCEANWKLAKLAVEGLYKLKCHSNESVDVSEILSGLTELPENILEMCNKLKESNLEEL